MYDAKLAERPAAARPNSSETVLEISGLQGFYGESHVLHGVTLNVKRGELVTLLGLNGAGKTSILRAIIGLLTRKGSIRFCGSETIALAPEAIARLGIGYVPEERGIFSSLSVEENLMLPPVVKPGGMALDEIYALFPNLLERHNSQGTKLSGGEQQMLAIARILRTGADLILLDEPTEGLAPVIIEQIGAVVRQLKARGLTILLVEQNFHFAKSIADRHYVVEEGRVVDMFTNASMDSPETIDRLNAYLGV